MDAVYGVQTGTPDNLNITYCTFNQNNNGAIGLPAQFTNAVITHNTFSNTGMIYGANEITYSGNNNTNSHVAIGALGAGSTIENNTITNTGYNAINFLGSNVSVKNNYINNFCRINNDGAGIYTWNNAVTPTPIYSGTVVRKNIIINSITNWVGATTDAGIYLDDMANGITVDSNYVSAVSNIGIYLHNDSNCVITDNTIYNCAQGMYIYNDKYALYEFNDVSVKHNKIIAKTATQLPIKYDYVDRIFATSFESDSNYITRPVDDGLTITAVENIVYAVKNFTLDQWKAYTTNDAHSLLSAYPVASSDSIYSIYATTTAKDTVLSKTYLDVAGNDYSGTITIPAWSSVILLDTTTYNQLLRNGLIFAADMEEASSPLTDSSGKGHTFTDSNLSYQQTGVNPGYSVAFNGTSSVTSIADANDLSIAETACTIELWFYANSFSTGPVMTNKPAEWQLSIATTGLMSFFVYDSVSTGNYVRKVTQTGAGTFAINTPYHVVVTYDGSLTADGMNIFKDNVLLSLSTANAGTLTNVKNSTNPVRIGDYGAGWFNGKIAQVRYWNRVLNGGEITRLNNNGSGRNTNGF